MNPYTVLAPITLEPRQDDEDSAVTYARLAATAEAKLASLRRLANEAADALVANDDALYAFRCALLLTALLGPDSIGRRAMDADPALKLVADEAERECSTCDGSRYVIDDNDRQTRCPDCGVGQ
jgi:hypothetical protein